MCENTRLKNKDEHPYTHHQVKENIIISLKAPIESFFPLAKDNQYALNIVLFIALFFFGVFAVRVSNEYKG